MIDSTFLRFALVGASLSLSLSGSVLAADEEHEQARVDFAWVRLDNAESCASQSELETAVEERLGYNPFQKGAGQRIEGLVEKRDGKWHAQLLDRDESGKTVGERDLQSEAPDCDSLTKATSLALALAIDGEAALAAKDEEPPAPPEEPKPPEPVKEEPVAPLPPPPQPIVIERPASFVSLGGTLGPFVLPGLAWGVELTSDLALSESWTATVGMNYFPEQQSDDGPAAIGVGLTTGHLGGCYRLRPGPVLVAGCSQLDVGAIHSVVYSPEPVDPGDRFYAAGALKLKGQLRVVSRTWVGVMGSLQIPFVSYSYSLEGIEEPLFQVPRVGGGGGLFVSRQF